MSSIYPSDCEEGDGVRSNKSFVLWDTSSGDAQVLYVSRGFQNLYGFASETCAGKTCLTWPCLQPSSQWDGRLQEQFGEATSKLKYLGTYSSLEHRMVAKATADRVGCAWSLDTKANHELFVCEHIIFNVRASDSPGSQAMCISIQQDISDQISVEDLVTIAGSGAFIKLMQARRTRIREELMRESVIAQIMPELQRKINRCVSQPEADFSELTLGDLPDLAPPHNKATADLRRSMLEEAKWSALRG